MSKSDKSDVFLSLDDDDALIPEPVLGPNSPKSRIRALKKTVKNRPTEVLDAEILDATMVTQATGIFDVSWPLLGMDCPDCASKATRALNFLPQVKTTKVSATAGMVTVEVDLEDGPLSEISSVLRSLGHAPDVPFHEIVGVRSSQMAQRNEVDQRKLVKILKQQPGVLDVEITDDERILLQLATEVSKEIFEVRDASLSEIIGTQVRYAPAESNRIRPDQWRLIGGGIALPLLVMVIIGEIIGMSNVVLGALALPGLIIGGSQMFKEAAASINNKQLGFQVLTSLAVIGAAILGMWEEALVVAILVAFTAHLEGDALTKAREAMQGGLDRLPRTARRITGNKPKSISQLANTGFTLQMATTPSPLIGADGCALPDPNSLHETVPIELIRIGDSIEIRSGELIPADGVIIEGHGSLDKAPLTGESVPVEVSDGDEIQAGLILARGPVVVRVTAVGDDTRLSGLIDAVHTFREDPPRLQSSIELFTAIWVPIVLLGAVAIWYFMFPQNWKVILLIWVVACPCALLLATPVPHAAALSRSAHFGAIARGGDVIERLSRVNHILLDKTGTLTSGKPRLGEFIMAKGKQRSAALKLAGGLEARSSHPYALSVMEYLDEQNIVPTQVSAISDIEAGVRGMVAGKEVMFIRFDRAASLDVVVPTDLQSAYSVTEAKGHGASLLVRGGEAIALVTFIHDDTHDGSKELISSLTARSINVEILSGDHQSAVSAFAKSVGLPESAAHGGFSPEQKVEWVKNRSKTHITMMVGDGFNDAAALALADVGVAVGTGETVNLEAADVLIPSDNPLMLTDLVDLARSAQRILIGNLLITVGITLSLVVAVIMQLYDELWVGVLIHEASVILVILNGARLAGGDGAIILLKSILKSLWFDTKDAFHVLKLRYLSQ
ncbi:MAG: heavy metal translocating P-type ATPase [Candidatus Poseidoniales archaeon]|nr:MAG: heavy metal translocating P-type ATPase [Candidatus Poseidoniales archaeon]